MATGVAMDVVGEGLFLQNIMVVFVNFGPCH